MGTIWGSLNKDKMACGKDLKKVEVVPSHICTQRALGANVFYDLFDYQNAVDSHCKCCPTSRSGHRSLCDLDYVYIIGGYNARINGTTTMREVWRLNTVTHAWSQVNVDGLFPETMASFVAEQRDYSMRHSLIFGGTGFPFGLSATNKLYSLKETSDETFRIDEEETTGIPPPPSYGSAFVAADDKTFYLIGGTTGQEYNLDIWKLFWSTENQRWNWTQLTTHRYDSPVGRYRHEAVLIKDLIIIFGGGTPQWSEQLEKLNAYNINEKRFLEIQTNPDLKHGFPQPRKCHAVVRYEDDVYIIGGCNEPPDAEFIGAQFYTVLNDLWKINLTTLQWTKLDTNLVNGVFFHSAVVTFEGCIYIFGGCCDGRSAVRTNRVQRIWIRPPSLQRLAMQTIVHYLPELLSQFPDRIRISNVSGVIRDFHNHLNSNAA
uniref:Kelch domain-containing protein 10 n=1 Tax=Acrobeloides nanus TaxID=290746 RepID=A0A914EB49_9BILA